MEISKLKTLTTPNINDVIPILDINGGVSGKPILRKISLQSVFELIDFPDSGSGGSSSGFTIPTTIKTAAESGDYFIGIDSTGTPYKIAKADLLAGLSNGNGVSAPSNTLLLLHGETIADSSTYFQSIINVGNVTVSSAQKKYGNNSLYFSGSNKLQISSSLFAFGTADFCFESFVYWQQTNFAGEPGIFQLSTVNGGLQPSYSNSLGIGTTRVGSVFYYFLIAANNPTVGSIALRSGEQDYFAIKRVASTTSMWINGIKACEIPDTTNYSCQNLCTGGYYSNSYLGNFYLDEFRISNIPRDVSVIPSLPFS